MLSKSVRTAILELHRKGLGMRRIAKTLKISRTSVKKVILADNPDPPQILRPSKAEPHRQEILELYAECRGNLVRVWEELQEKKVELSYPALTAFCRREGIGQKPKVASGRYDFLPGQETQHDTSPHRAKIGGRWRKIQTAGAILCYSRMRFVQCYPRFRRFECKIFLSEALRFFRGATEVMMIDNTHVVVLTGTGAEMIPVPEMEAFGQRFGFTWKAHEKGDANRSARVERLFWHVETNFLAGRSFTDWKDLNQQARDWCEKANATYKRNLKAKPVELYATERAHLKPLPVWIPEPYLIHHRTVDVERYVALDTNRYSVPEDWIGRQVQVRETQERLEIQTQRAPAVIHQKVIDPCAQRTTLPEHRRPRGRRRQKDPSREETALLKQAPEIADYVAELKKKGRKSTILALRQLLRMVREYPREPLVAAIDRAAHYGLFDLDRVERMVLRHIADVYFRLPPFEKGDDE